MVATRGSLAQWWLVLVLAVLTMLSAVDRLIIALLLDPIRRDLVLSDTQVSLLYGLAFALIYSLATIPSGWAADRWRRRPLAFAGALVWSAMTMVCGLSASYWPFFAARMGVGLSESVLGPTAQSMIRDGVDRSRHGRGYAALALAGFVGAGLSALLGGLLVEHATRQGIARLPLVGGVQPWQYALLVAGALGIPVSCLALTVFEPLRQRAGIAVRAPADASPGYGAALDHIRRHWQLYVPLIGYAVFHMMLSGAYAAWLPPLLGRKWHYTPVQIGQHLGAALFIGPTLGLLAGGFIIDRIARGPRSGTLPLVGVAASLLIGVAGAAGPFAASSSSFWTCYYVLTIATGVPLPVIATIVAQRTPSQLMGKIVALQLTASGVLGTAAAPTLVALLADGPFRSRAVPIATALGTGVAVFATLCVGLCLLVYRDWRTGVNEPPRPG